MKLSKDGAIGVRPGNKNAELAECSLITTEMVEVINAHPSAILENALTTNLSDSAPTAVLI